MIIEQNHNVSESLNTVVPENLVGICEASPLLSPFQPLPLFRA